MHHLSVQLNSLCSHLHSGLQSHEFTNMPTYISAHTHTCTQTHTRCPEVSEFFRTYSPFVLLSALSVNDTLTSASLDSDIPALTLISTDKKKVGQIGLSPTI